MAQVKEEGSILALEMANLFGAKKKKTQSPESVKVKRGTTIGQIISYLASYNLNR
jgi:hypothetical protein